MRDTKSPMQTTSPQSSTLVTRNPNRTEAVKRWLAGRIDNLVILRLVQFSDCRFIHSLRTDHKLNQHLSTVKSDLVSQKTWLKSYFDREFSGLEFYFLIILDGNPVGTVRVYDLRTDSFTWGSWIIKAGTSPLVALKSVALVYELGFNLLEYTKSIFEVRKGNISVIRFHLRTGAQLVGEDDLHYKFIMTPEVARQRFHLN
jgi:hypothetical protein